MNLILTENVKVRMNIRYEVPENVKTKKICNGASLFGKNVQITRSYEVNDNMNIMCFPMVPININKAEDFSPAYFIHGQSKYYLAS